MKLNKEVKTFEKCRKIKALLVLYPDNNAVLILQVVGYLA